jgi:Reverse transcriptase (RNA-dependent DNA polymerase)
VCDFVLDFVNKYIAIYVDDLAITMKNPRKFTDVLQNKHKFKLKGTGPITFHLGMDFTRDDNGELCISPTKYIEKLIKNYEKLFGSSPKEFASSLEKGDHPEVDMLELCTTEQVAQYQPMIRSLQWIATIGRFDIHTAVMTMSGFCITPRIRHLERLRRYKVTYRKCGLRQFASGLKNPIIPIDRTTSMIGRIQYMAIPKKCYQKMHPNR